MKEIFQALENQFDEMVEIRRHLHKYPELSFEEVKTPHYIANYHEKLGLEVQTKVGGRGVVATLKGAHPGPVVALRADFDALPIEDAKDVEYRSTVPGVMHACGHDGHTATLLVLAKVLSSQQNELHGTIKFIHQHAEEQAPGGAIAMIEDGCMEGVDVVFGTHLWATEEIGKIQYNEGALMAAADRFELTIQGKGGHGAQPHDTKDSIVIGSQLVQSLQQIVSRRIDPLYPAVVSVGSFEAKNAFNVIADSAKLIGTVRTFDANVQEQIQEEIKKIAEGTALSTGADISFHYAKGYPALINHKDEARLAAQVLQSVDEVTEVEHAKPQMGGEDFSYYLHHAKGAFFFTGAKHPDTENPYPHHHPKFDFDERAMVIAAKSLATLAFHYVGADKKAVNV
ncbi:amidohydrolase [Bacillus sp. H-16]|uniref:M20 metallopeptidase family protein n=1 Tax=Alteribacter salitolerans TaxID=2912333 RepID=UPI001965D1CA|nr:amidohydrolase [Alteribacter salitolerans]MBM7097788.1 amidohydrolase [Alteribacter salitolerans]